LQSFCWLVLATSGCHTELVGLIHADYLLQPSLQDFLSPPFVLYLRAVPGCQGAIALCTLSVIKRPLYTAHCTHYIHATQERWGFTPPPLHILKTRSPAVARMADRTAPVVKLTLTLTLTGHNLAKQTLLPPLNGPIVRQNKAYKAIFCTLRTSSGFIFLLPVV